jgi:hypothetical protein
VSAVQQAARRHWKPCAPRPFAVAATSKQREDSQVPRALKRIGHVLATFRPMRHQHAYYTRRIGIGRVTYRATLGAVQQHAQFEREFF